MNNTVQTKKNILILSNKPWNDNQCNELKKRINRKVVRIKKANDLTVEAIEHIDPEWIFVPHWNNIIRKEIWEKWKTVIFHMTDLPYGRGGSPLQNMIKEGKEFTMISAIKCDDELDSGDIYLKKELSLYGSAEEIYLRANEIIINMMEEIVTNKQKPVPQTGTIKVFQRRKPADSDLTTCRQGDLQEWYDHIRMLDAEGYPHAFIEVNGMRLEFRRVAKKSGGLIADVQIVRSDDTK